MDSHRAILRQAARQPAAPPITLLIGGARFFCTMSKPDPEPPDLFKSLSPEEFEQLPRPSLENIRRALDEGRPVEHAGCISPPPWLSSLRFL